MSQTEPPLDYSLDWSDDMSEKPISIKSGMKIRFENLGEITLQERWHAGGSATIYRGIGDNGEEFAIKRYRPRINDLQHQKDVELEMQVSFDHPSICRCLGHTAIELSSGRESHLLAFPFFEGPELSELLLPDEENSRGMEEFYSNEKVLLCYRISEAISIVHQEGWLHGDISDRNILLNPDPETMDIQLIDFEFARPAEMQPLNGEIRRGTPEYWAPEMIEFKWRGSSKMADIWAVGMLIGHIMDPHFKQYLGEIGGWRDWLESRGSNEPVLPEKCPEGFTAEVWSMVRKCTIISRNLRPDAKELERALHSLLEV